MYKVLGIMSGTSLDGVDLAFSYFYMDGGKWEFEVVEAETVPYDTAWKNRLSNLERESALAYAETNVRLGEHFGKLAKTFIDKYHLMPDFIASHGHTIFHQPDRKLTTQIGSPASMAAICQMPVISDFRALDVALGGQGAPLVPIGDMLLFPDYNYCLNLGGIANISAKQKDNLIAYDISPANMVLNYLAEKKGQAFDRDGKMARSGKIITPLFDSLNRLAYYSKSWPKSIGKEWVTSFFMPTLEDAPGSAEDKLCTITHHIAFQIQKAFEQLDKQKKGGKMMITGGGAHNKFLVEQIKHYVPHIKVTLPEKHIIDFKEALIFSFLGVLRWRTENNTLRSVTGSTMDSCGGSIFYVSN